jgi:hypothetical protein
MDGTASVGTDFEFSGGEVSADLPVNIDFTVPDEVVAGQPFTLESNWELDTTAVFVGQGPSYDVVFDVSADNLGIKLDVCLLGECSTEVDETWNFPTTIIREFEFEAIPFTGNRVDQDEVPYRLAASYTDAPALEMVIPWDAYILQALQYLNLPANIGSFEKSAGDYTFAIDYMLWHIQYQMDVIMEQALQLDVMGITGTITWEGDVAGPSFEVGTPTQITPPANGDLDDDGDIDMTITLEINAQFGNDTNFNASLSHHLLAAGIEVDLVQANNTPPSKIGPLLDLSVGANVDLPKAHTFTLSGFNTLEVVGAIDLAE